MTIEPQIIWLCPLCRKPVLEQSAHVAALEGEYQRGVEHTTEPAWLHPVRFHDGHFTPRIRGKIYTIDDHPLVTPEEPVGSVVDAIRAAYDALGEGRVEPLVALMDTDLEWRGRRSGLQFWRPPPS